MAKPRIAVLALGKVDTLIPKVIGAHIAGYLAFETRQLPPCPVPQNAFSENRLQFDAGAIITELEQMELTGCEKVVAVTNVDLFLPIFTHVFGEARQGGQVALVSVYRLGNNPGDPAPPPALLYERVAKVALHELGHLIDLIHCDDRRCLMHFSGDLEELDRVPLLFCRYCRAFLTDHRR